MTSIYSQMEDDLNFSKMEDDLNFFKNETQPQYFQKWKIANQKLMLGLAHISKIFLETTQKQSISEDDLQKKNCYFIICFKFYYWRFKHQF